VIDAIDTFSQNTPGKWQRFVNKQAGTIVPGFLLQARKEVDPEVKEVWTMMDSIKSRIPGFSKDVKPHVNLLGEDVHYEGGLGPDIASPVAQMTENPHPGAKEIARLNVDLQHPLRQIGGGDGAPGVELNGDQYYRLMKILGKEAAGVRASRRRWRSSSTSEHYKGLPEDPHQRDYKQIKQKEIELLYEGMKQAAVLQLISEDKDLRDALHAEREEQGQRPHRLPVNATRSTSPASPRPPHSRIVGASTPTIGASSRIGGEGPLVPYSHQRRKTCVSVLVCPVPDQPAPRPDRSRVPSRTSPSIRSRCGRTDRLLVDGVDYTWPTTSTIQLVANAVNGDTIEIRRNSLKKADGTQGRLVDWANSAKITEANLDKADLQCFYLAQEALDAAANALQLVSDGTFDALGKRIKNVANPTLAQDAATKNYVDLLALGSFPSPLAVGSGGTGGNPGNWTIKSTAGVGYGVLTSLYSIDAPLPGVASAARNLAVRTDATTPNSKVNVTADQVVLWTIAGTGGRSYQTVNVTADMAVTGAANGLDVAGEAANTWYYVWLIGKWDGTIAALLSASSGTPTMPAGYTHRALVGAVRNDGSSNFIKFRQRGNDAYYEAPQGVLSGGAASAETVVSCASFVPPIAHSFTVSNLGGALAATDGAGNIDFGVYVRLISGVDYQTLARLNMSSQGAGQGRVATVAPCTLPNISQQFYYYYNYSAGSASGGVSLYVQSFKLPLGGE
jgi:hypothetical protein